MQNNKKVYNFTNMGVNQLDLNMFKFPSFYSDCRLFSFRLLFSYYGYFPSDQELLGIGEGLDFQLLNVSPLKTKMICPVGRTKNFEVMYAQKMGIPIKEKVFSKDCTVNEVVFAIKKIINNYNPVVVNVDRYYLNYLTFKKAHVGLHTIIIVGYDDGSNSFLIIDGLNDTKVINLAFNDLYTAIMSDCIISTERLWYYIEKSEKSVNPKTQYISATAVYNSINNVSNNIVTNCVEPIKLFINHINSSSKNAANLLGRYINLQSEIFLDSFSKQDRSHLFYRDVYFQFIKDNIIYFPEQNRNQIKDCCARVLEYIDALASYNDYTSSKWIFLLDSYLDEEVKLHQFLLDII